MVLIVSIRYTIFYIVRHTLNVTSRYTEAMYRFSSDLITKLPILFYCCESSMTGVVQV